MGLRELLHMNPGNGETSYANNSGLQYVMMSKPWGLVEETLRDLFESAGSSDCCLNMVDLGCASGPNALSVVSHVMDTIQDLCERSNSLKEVRFFLNDLPHNDFNNLFKLMDIFNQGNEVASGSRSRCYVYGLPGSFYSRLFPRTSLHFAYSSCSLHWLSQVPRGLESQNKENIYISTTSPPEVLHAYAEQYKRDFFTFLRARAEEMVPGGCMVLTIPRRCVEDPSTEGECAFFTILVQTLLDMVSQGLLEKDDLYSFNMPVYIPCQQEVESIINHEGSFKLKKIVSFAVCWDANKASDELPFDKNRSGKLVADSFRAFMEPLLVSHFGKFINCDVLFERFAEKMAEHLSKERSSYYMLSISLKFETTHNM
ncbi:S-adenosyl-L-methionine:carboxyl methyltransferase family protein [Dorcoceras hygrometricum]|uniref:S-adenosyl-L-methionine:carboxyl methyltransferase family protein n=1 Tax=Dorcoceras hygrometricum TaxID=472368 RepID=A0A2Z7BH27_9LAMI|nr:S-adenosyl-L-methionine:carboxyl methyltransferase family protein [Dorcoceras hygrometricum]